MLASISRVTLETPIGTMRLEQPAIAAVALVLIATGRWRRLLEVDPKALVIAAGFATYLAVLGISSALVAPQPVDSLRLVAWLAISMVGGVVAMLLAWPDPEGSILPLAVGASLKGAVGIGVALLFLIAGPEGRLRIQEADGMLPRVHAFTWEANLYASSWRCAFHSRWRRRGARHERSACCCWRSSSSACPWARHAAPTSGSRLGSSSTPWFIVAERRVTDVSRLAGGTLAFFLVGLVASSFLLPNLVERAIGVDIVVPGLSPPSSGPSETFDPAIRPHRDRRRCQVSSHTRTPSPSDSSACPSPSTIYARVRIDRPRRRIVRTAARRPFNTAPRIT